MQITLVAITVFLALFYVIQKGYKAFFAKQNKCEGCAFSKSTENATK